MLRRANTRWNMRICVRGAFFASRNSKFLRLRWTQFSWMTAQVHRRDPAAYRASRRGLAALDRYPRSGLPEHSEVLVTQLIPMQSSPVTRAFP